MGTIQNDDSSDTDLAARMSVFAADADPDRGSPGSHPRAYGTTAPPTANAEAPNSVHSSSVHSSDDVTKRSFDLRRLIEQHPIAAGAVAIGAIGVGIIGYRWMRHSLPVRLYLALRFGRFRELLRT